MLLFLKDDGLCKMFLPRNFVQLSRTLPGSNKTTTGASLDNFSVVVYNIITKQIFLNEFGETDCNIVKLSTCLCVNKLTVNLLQSSTCFSQYFTFTKHNIVAKCACFL